MTVNCTVKDLDCIYQGMSLSMVPLQSLAHPVDRPEGLFETSTCEVQNSGDIEVLFHHFRSQ